MGKIGLSELIFPTTKAEFFESYWPNKPFVVHGLDQSVKPLRSLPFLKSLDSILKSWPSMVQAHLPDLADEASSIDVSALDARKLFNNQIPLLFNNVQKFSSELTDWLKAIRADLGLPSSTFARCLVYATPDGKGTAPHFDQNINFVLQLHGTKTWWLAPNENVTNPTQRHTMGQPIDPEVEPYVQGEMPKVMPKNHQEVVLKPGSMLFVPRGYWHSTEASGEALALNFTFNQPTWVDLFTMALRSRLTLSPQWRELADGVTSSDEERRLIAQEKFDVLLADLVEDLPNWRAEDILGSTEGTLPGN